MRNMSFSLTTEQVRKQTKTVTRRLGWTFAKVGDLVQPVVKSQGLEKGESPEKIGAPIRFVAVDRVILSDISVQDIHREGFPNFTRSDFIRLFKQANGCRRNAKVTRIAFEYTEPLNAVN